MIFVLDTSFFLYGMDPSSMDGEVIITPEVEKEVEKGFPARKLRYFTDSGILKILSPEKKSLEKVRETAEKTGDIGKLSETDISVIAMAVEKNAVLLSDDYSVQNVARVLGIECRALREDGIKEIWKWTYRCTGCGRRFGEHHEVCPVCGSALKTVLLSSPKNNSRK